MQRRLDEAQSSLRSLQTNSEREAAELRSEVKMRTFELERMAMQQEESAAHGRQLQLQLDMHRRVFFVLRECTVCGMLTDIL